MLLCTKAKNKLLKRSNQSLQVKIQETELEGINKTNYLGVQIDNNLDWKDQIRAVSSKVSRGIGLLKHAKRFLPPTTLKSH